MEDSYDSFRWYDYVIFGVTLAISLCIGVYYAVTGGKQQTTNEYLLGDRNMNIIPVAMSVFVSGISGILLMGAPAEFYEHGITSYYSCFGGALAMCVGGFLIVPTTYGLGYTSIFTYLQKRFESDLLRLVAAFFNLLTQIMYVGLAIYSPAVALEAVAGIPYVGTVLVTGAVVTLYSTIGGLKGVVGTDVFQGAVMFGGCLLVVILGSIRVGSLSEAWTIAKESGRFETDFTPTPFVRMSFWSAFVGTFSSNFLNPTNQTVFQRTVAIKNKRGAIIMSCLFAPQYILIYSLVYLCGVVSFAFYHKIGCDPLQSGQISSSNQILPFFIMNGLQIPGIPGLFTAVLFCAVLSSVSSSLNSMSAVMWKDFLEPCFHSKNLSESQHTTIHKILVCICGVIGVGIAFLFNYVKGNFLQISNTVFGAIIGPAASMFLIGMFFPWIEWVATLCGLIVGFALSATMSVGTAISYPWRETMPTNIANCSNLGYYNVTADYGENVEYNPLFMVSFQWYYFLSCVVTIGFALIVSIFIRNKSEVDPHLQVPFFDRLFCCLPESWRRRLRCGVDYSNVLVDERGRFTEEQANNTYDNKGHTVQFPSEDKSLEVNAMNFGSFKMIPST